MGRWEKSGNSQTLKTEVEYLRGKTILTKVENGKSFGTAALIKAYGADNVKNLAGKITQSEVETHIDNYAGNFGLVKGEKRK